MPKKSRCPTVLVVEDEIETLNFVYRVLELGSYNVVRAEDGVAALNLMNTAPPDLIILDLGMPKFDGFAVMLAMKKDPRLAAIPVVVLTASADDEKKKRAVKLGVKGYIVKPVDISTLKKTAAAALSRQKTSEGPG